MDFKIHSKLNRIAEVSASMQDAASRIAIQTKEIQKLQKSLDLLMVHYMQMETEYGELIGEEIDNKDAVEELLTKHGMEKER